MGLFVDYIKSSLSIGFIKKDEDGNVKYLKSFQNICLLIFFVSVVYFFIVNYFSQLPEGGNNRGTFGDLFGGLNALFSGFAFAGVIITIIMQMKELELTRDELRKSVEAQDESQIALNKQLESMQLSTQINYVNEFIDSNQSDSDKKFIGEAILSQ